MCTLDSLDRNLDAAKRADLGGWLCGCFRLFAERSQLIDRFEQTEQHERRDQKVDDRGDECTVAQFHTAEVQHETA